MRLPRLIVVEAESTHQRGVNDSAQRRQSVESVSIQDLSIAPQYNGVDVEDEMQQITTLLNR